MEGFTLGMTIGMLLGLGVGISLGISIGKKQKPWEELTEKEKKQRIAIIGSGIILLSIGAIVGLWRFITS